MAYLEPGLGIRWLSRGAGARRGGEATALVASRNHQNLTARRARRMRSQPLVDARQVEPVAALRQHSDFVAGGELRQADRAVGELARGLDGGGELGEGAEDLLLNAFVGGGRRRRRSGGGGGEAEAAEAGAAGDGDEAEDADEGADEGGEDDDEVGVDDGGGGGVAGRGGGRVAVLA